MRRPPQLTHLDLSGNEIGDDDAHELAALTRITSLGSRAFQLAHPTKPIAAG